MKKFLSFLLCFLMLFLMSAGSWTASAAVQSGSCESGIVWSYDDETGTLTLSGIGATVKADSMYKYPWYSFRNSIKSLIIESGVAGIADYAFDGYASLNSVSIPDSVIEIGMGALTDTPWNNSLPDGMNYLGRLAYCYRGDVPSDGIIEIRDGTVGTADYAFSRCKAEKIILPDSITRLGKGAFFYCEQLKHITLPKNITSIPHRLFSSCTTIEEIVIPQGVTSIGFGAFEVCKALTYVTVPGSVTEIGDYAFNACFSLVSLRLPSGVKTIGSEVFSHCSALKMVTFPDSITSIGKGVFTFTPNVAIRCNSGSYAESYAISHGLPYAPIPETDYDVFGTLLAAYYGRDTEIVVPDSVTEIGGGVFYGKDKIKSVKLPDGVTTIGGWAFSGCASLETINLPSTVTEIGDDAFAGCESLKAIDIPTGVTKIGDEAFFGCSLIKSVNIPSGLTEINQYAFFKCASLESVTIPSGVTRINKYAFSLCTSLKSVVISDGVTEILNFAFFVCEALETITVPDSVIKIGDGALTYTAWYDLQPDGIVYAGNAVITYKGEMPENCALTLHRGATVIADSAFAELTSLVSVTIPDGTVKIGDYAFNDCTSLASVTIPASINRIGTDAFTGCSTVTFRGSSDTYAEKFAIAHHIPFIAIDKCEHTPDAAWTIDIAMTPTIHGLKSHHCTKCGMMFDETELPYLGDITCDSKINALDILKIKLSLAQKVTLDDNQQLSADFTKDGKVNALDLLRVKLYIAGKVS